MTITTFDHNLTPMPADIHCFILPSTILLPRGQIPVQVDTAETIHLIDQALKTDRMIGVVQPQILNQANHQLYSSGTLGRITTFIERTKNHYFILLSGICRFDVQQTLFQQKSYCRLQVDYHRFHFDVFEDKVQLSNRQNLINILKDYFMLNQIQTNWDDLEHASDDDLMSSLTLICPFEPAEKQALLESPTAQKRYEMMTDLMELVMLRETNPNLTTH